MEEGTVEAVHVAASITKEVFNPLAKLTRGLQNAVLSKGQPKAEPAAVSSNRLCSSSN